MPDFIECLLHRHRQSPRNTKASHLTAGTGKASTGVQPVNDVIAVRDSGLFEADWYTVTYPDVAESGMDPLIHYCQSGRFEGRNPNPYFSTDWYLQHNIDVHSSRINPLLHYALGGEREDRQPSIIFDPKWYRNINKIALEASCLRHFLERRRSGVVSPIPEFDVQYYLEQYPDIRAAKVDPFEHYLIQGYKELRNPSGTFDTRFYVQRYLRDRPSEHPFLHFLQHRGQPGIYTSLPLDEATASREVRRFTQRGPAFEDFRPISSSASRRAKVLAYYLPQFHCIPENDKWWGKGFTEWTNLARGQPRFVGHYQPRIPRDLGFYNLNDSEVIHRQIEMARGAGLFGFVLYMYWFNGRRLLEGPLDRFANDSSLEFPFCLMWANENWTRRWDGSDSEILISQDYAIGDEESLIAAFAGYFKDPRYIRLVDRPVLMIYRPRLIPDAARTVARWRALFRSHYQEDPIIVSAQCFGDNDPREFGLDGAVEFPPHKLVDEVSPISGQLEFLDFEATSQVYSYEDIAKASLESVPASFPLIKTVAPGWDNDARRQGRGGVVLHNSSPAKYQAWLEGTIEHANRHKFFGEALVCVNAWNEWAEGAYLEPDKYFGSAYLNATARAVTRVGSVAGHGKILLVGHDAFPGGSQQLLLNLARQFSRAHGVTVAILLLSSGELLDAYDEIGAVTLASGEAALPALARDFYARGFRRAIVNTSAAGNACEHLAGAGITCTLLVHELPRIIAEKNLLSSARTGLANAQCTVFASSFVRDKFFELCGTVAPNAVVMPQGSYKDIRFSHVAREAIRSRLGIGSDACLAIGVGYADLRKGIDLFLQVWMAAQRAGSEMHFCWVGGTDPNIAAYLSADIAAAEGTGRFHMAGFCTNVADYYSAADIFVLTSREDPFPTVVLEAMMAGTAAVAFDGAGGIPDMLHRVAIGAVVDFPNVGEMAQQVVMLSETGRSAAERERVASIARQNFSFRSYAKELFLLGEPSPLRISVIVPNYNYGKHLRRRLELIFNQTHPVNKIIVLDDCSKDQSIQIAAEVAEEFQRDIQLDVNEVNSGSVFAQWRKGAELAEGDYVWIAEADDESDPQFLEQLAQAISGSPDVALALTDSRAIDATGAEIWPNYQEYYRQAGAEALAHDGIWSGPEFARRFMAERNLILNVSSVLWRREDLLAALDRCKEELRRYRLAGDWHLYMEVLTSDRTEVAYVARPLNIHRRHAASVTHSLDPAVHLDEIQRLHRFAADRLGLDRDMLNRQRAYLNSVAESLGSARAPSSAPNRAASAAGGGFAKRSSTKSHRSASKKTSTCAAARGRKKGFIRAAADPAS